LLDEDDQKGVAHETRRNCPNLAAARSGWLIYGCRSAYTGEVAEVIWRLGEEISLYIDNLPGDTALPPLQGRVIGPHDLTRFDLFHPTVIPVLTPGYRYTIEAEARAHGLTHFPKLIDPTAVVARTATIGDGTVLNALAVIGARSHLGRFVHVNRAASVGHDVAVHDFATLGPSCVVAGGVVIERGVFVGAGAVLTPSIRIGANAMINAGAVVTKDVQPNAVVAGNPACVKREAAGGYNDVVVPDPSGNPPSR
jgi:sugar O-acyltransferase (sialic acid O-acetyltransferase NeuD family)